MLWLVDRFGWETAHTAPALELRRMLLAENVYRAATGYASAKDPVEWARANPEWSKIHNAAQRVRRAVNDGED